MSSKYSHLIEKTYAGFNARNIDDVFTVLHPNVKWPMAFKGGYITEHDAVRNYWTEQWSEINPIVNPSAMEDLPDGRIEVDIYQLVKDLDGNVLFDGKVKHTYTVKDGLLAVMKVDAG